MTYRAVCRHVRYWRGAIHKWSTVYQFVGTPSTSLTSADAQLVLNADNKMLFGTGVNAGGTYACALYNQSSGGVPIAVYTAFDWTAPGSWVGGSATAWAAGSSLEPVAEVALSVRWPAGLSSSGKPVTIRKWYHMVPVSQAASAGAADVSTANLTALRTAAASINGVLGAKGLTLGASSGRIAGTGISVDPYYNNHQMARGRRRRITSQTKAAVNYEKVLQLIEGNAYSQ